VRSSLLAATLAVAIALPALAAEQKHLAVLEFEVAPGMKIDRTYFSDLARGAVKSQAPQLFVMTRESTEVLLQANGKTLADCTGECEVEIGRKLGADYIISGRITQIGARTSITLRLFSTSDGELLSSAEARGTKPEELQDEMQPTLAKLLSPLPKSAGPRNAAPAATESRIGGEAREVSLGSDEQVIVPFDSTPPGAVVMLDGKLLCQATPCSKLIAGGAHEVSMQREGYDAQSAQLAAKKGASVNLSLPRIAARVAVETTPAGLTVSIDGKVVGRSPLPPQELAPGGHEIVVEDACWTREGERVALKRGEERTVRIAPKERQAGLKVSAEDEKGNALEAKVLVDGREVGIAPGSFKVSVCSKKLEFNSGELGAEEELKLSEGQVREVRAKLVHIGPGVTFVELPGGVLRKSIFYNGQRVASFKLARTATTVAQYQKCVAAGGCTKPGNGGNCNWGKDRLDHPVNCVDWNQASGFCKWMGARLPTAKEREWAASSGVDWTYPWGNGEPGAKACWSGNGNDRDYRGWSGTCPAGSHPTGASTQGIQDLAGNVWEWVANDNGGGKETRGGSWFNDNPGSLQVLNSYDPQPIPLSNIIGFRCGL